MGERKFGDYTKDLAFPVLPEGPHLNAVRQFVAKGFGKSAVAEGLGMDEALVDGLIGKIREDYGTDGRNPFVAATRVAYLRGQLSFHRDRSTGFPLISSKPVQSLQKLVEYVGDPVMRSILREIAEGNSDRKIAEAINREFDLKGEDAFWEDKVRSLNDKIRRSLGVNRQGLAILNFWVEEQLGSQAKGKSA